jgi:hypothetical protein
MGLKRTQHMNCATTSQASRVQAPRVGFLCSRITNRYPAINYLNEVVFLITKRMIGQSLCRQIIYIVGWILYGLFSLSPTFSIALSFVDHFPLPQTPRKSLDEQACIQTSLMAPL